MLSVWLDLWESAAAARGKSELIISVNKKKGKYSDRTTGPVSWTHKCVTFKYQRDL